VAEEMLEAESDQAQPLTRRPPGDKRQALVYSRTVSTRPSLIYAMV